MNLICYLQLLKNYILQDVAECVKREMVRERRQDTTVSNVVFLCVLWAVSKSTIV